MAGTGKRGDVKKPSIWKNKKYFGNYGFNKQGQIKKVSSINLSYFEEKAEKDRRRKQKYDELSLEYALSQVFSPKQKELFMKKLEGLPFTKTEQEYFSRTVKKKVLALANSELHSLSEKILGL